MSDRVTLGDADDRRLKRKMTEESSSEPPPPSMDADDEDSSEGLLALMLMAGGEPTEAGAAKKEETAPGNNNDNPQQNYSCKFCDKKFRSTRALGGHQNAHKRERLLSKINREIDMGNFGRFGAHCFCPYSTIPNFTTTGSPFRAGFYHHHMMNPPPAHYGLQAPAANSALEAFPVGSRSSWADDNDGTVERRGNRRNNVRSSSPANPKPDEQGSASASAEGGPEANSTMEGLDDTPSNLDLSLSL